MKGRRRNPALLACITVLLLTLILVGLGAFAQNRQQQQEHLDRALFAAVNANDTKAVVSLLTHGADANACAVVRATVPFRVRMVPRIRGRKRKPSHAVSPLLFALMAKVDHNGYTGRYPPENLSLIRALLEHGANPNFCNQDGETPLLNAISGDKITSIHLLLKHGADANLGSPLALEVMPPITHPGYSHENASVVEDLLDHEAKVNERDSDGYTPLLAAIANRDIATVKVLLAHHANVSIRASDGLTPLARAMQAIKDDAEYPDVVRYNQEIIRLLKAAGAKQ